MSSADPLILHFSVACQPQHAFEVFTEKASSWWPPTHSRSGAPESVSIEPRVGGRIFERTASGEEHDWGEVLSWEPPQRLAYLWHIYGPREKATRVEIAFDASEDGTEITVHHSGFERLGAEGQTLRERNQRGWQGLMSPFLAACARA